MKRSPILNADLQAGLAIIYALKAPTGPPGNYDPKNVPVVVDVAHREYFTWNPVHETWSKVVLQHSLRRIDSAIIGRDISVTGYTDRTVSQLREELERIEGELSDEAVLSRFNTRLNRWGDGS